MLNVCNFESHIFYSHEVYPQTTRYKMTQLSCKWDTKSKSHPGTKFAQVRVFSCKHPLIYHRNYVITSSKLNWNHESHCKVLNILWHHFYSLQECRPWKIVIDLFFTITFNFYFLWRFYCCFAYFLLYFCSFKHQLTVRNFSPYVKIWFFFVHVEE